MVRCKEGQKYIVGMSKHNLDDEKENFRTWTDIFSVKVGRCLLFVVAARERTLTDAVLTD